MIYYDSCQCGCKLTSAWHTANPDNVLLVATWKFRILKWFYGTFRGYKFDSVPDTDD